MFTVKAHYTDGTDSIFEVETLAEAKAAAREESKWESTVFALVLDDKSLVVESYAGEQH